VNEQDLVLLVTPIDLAAPAGRLILPQVETIRDLLDRDCAALIVKERELHTFYHRIGIKPALVITDSQAFHKVAADIPEDQPLTSFSILFARKKGDPSLFIRSLNALKNFPQKGRVLVMEVCSHHRQAEDLGTVKIPRLFRQLVGSQVEFGHTRKVPKDPEAWDMVIHCAGCMITQKAMDSRLEIFRQKGIPVLNYGLFLAWANGLLPRALEPFPELAELFLENNPL
jgi:[FeFe] hydrogenase H-cluster maturation GTPase HydF